MNKHLTTAGLLTVGLCHSLVSTAAVVNWIGLDGAWEDGATNWSSGSPPGALDFVHIPYNGAVSSSASGNTALEAINFSALSVTAGSLDITGTLDTAGAAILNDRANQGGHRKGH